jgi:hypothetical protein
MQIINESQSEFRQKIGCYLEQSAPYPQNISIEEITNLLPLSLRELAWMIAICEAKYSYNSIPWELPTLRDRVEVLHNVFLKQITDEISMYAASDAMDKLSFDARTDAIHKLMGIEWEMSHDYDGKGIPTYYVFSINDTELLKSIFVRLLSAIKAKFVTKSFEPVQMMPWIKQHNKQVRSNQIIHLLNKICVESPLKIEPGKIHESIQSYNLAWVINICNKGMRCLEEVQLQELELTPLAEITNNKIINTLQESGLLINLKPRWFDEVDLRGSGAVQKILSYELPPSVVLKLLSMTSIYKVDSNIAPEPKYQHVPPVGCSITIIMNIQNKYSVDARTFNIETSNNEQSNKPPSPYSGNEINIVVVSVILPKLLPDKKSKPDINKLSWEVFEQLTDALNANGASVSHNIPEGKVNKKHCQIVGVDSHGEQINLSYEALKKRIESSLLEAYQQDTPPKKDNFKD